MNLTKHGFEWEKDFVQHYGPWIRCRWCGDPIYWGEGDPGRWFHWREYHVRCGVNTPYESMTKAQPDYGEPAQERIV